MALSKFLFTSTCARIVDSVEAMGTFHSAIPGHSSVEPIRPEEGEIDIRLVMIEQKLA